MDRVLAPNNHVLMKTNVRLLDDSTDTFEGQTGASDL